MLLSGARVSSCKGVRVGARGFIVKETESMTEVIGGARGYGSGSLVIIEAASVQKFTLGT